MKQLDDPANPYRDQYGDWDRWIVEHHYEPAEKGDRPVEDGSAGYYVLSAWTDNNGWLLPLREKERNRCEGQRRRGANMLGTVYPYSFNAAGAMDQKLLISTRTAIARVRAPYLPAVPKWLADSPPEWSIILPDGRVVMEAWTRGAWDPPQFSEYAAPDEAAYGWWMYDHDGNFLNATLPHSYWFEATFPALRQSIAAYALPFTNVAEQYGHIHVYNMNDRAHPAFANFNWDGTPEEANLKLHDRDGNPFLGIHGFDLPIVYEEQQKLQKSAAAL